MNHRPFFHVLLFIASMIITGSLLLGISGCTPTTEKKQPEPPPQPKAAPLPPIPANLPRSVDFDNMPLSSVAQFVTAQTGKGFILSGNDAKPITWIESNLTKDKIFDSFKATLTASGLTLKPGNPEETLFVIEQPEEVKVPCKLDFASSKRGTFFLFDATIYPKETFPFPLQQQGGHWYALVPKSVADRLAAASQHAAQ